MSPSESRGWGESGDPRVQASCSTPNTKAPHCLITKPASCSISIIPYHPRSVVHGVEASPGQRSLGPAEGCSLLSPMQLIAGGLHSARQR